MPRLSVFFIRAALLYLVVGFTLGGLILANKGIPYAPAVWSLLPVHVELLFLGWMTQLALGVAFWILPRLPSPAPRGEERWSWAAFYLLNGGIGWYALASLAGAGEWGMVARLMETAALLAFTLGNWKRIYALKFPAPPA